VQTHLASGAKITTLHPRGAGYCPANLVDDRENTDHAPADGFNTDTITIDLGTVEAFDCLMIQEVIQLGCRTTGWSVDYPTDCIN
jgi:alpha-L-fucosidase